jgi:Arc/MetJ family transcription regulator
MKETLRLTALKTKREAVELGLRTVVRLRKQEEIRQFRGKLDWHGDLDAMRTDKYSDKDFDPFVKHLDLRTALPGGLE